MNKKQTPNDRGRRLGAMASALLAAAATAAAFAAFSIAQGGDGNGSGTQVRAAPGPPPGVGFVMRAPSKQDREALQAFQDCMSEQGIDPPNPGDGPPAAPSKELREKLDQALKACSDKLPEGAPRRLPGPPPPCDGDKGKDQSQDQSSQQ
jgi:hypothetical protein